MKLAGIRLVAYLLIGGVVLVASTGPARASSTSVTAFPASATVSGSSPVTMGFPLERLGDLGFDAWLHYQTEDGTAKAGTDYTAASGDIRMPAGSSEKSISVQVSGKAAFAPDKQLTLKLLGVAGVGPTPSFAERVSFAAGGIVVARARVGDLNGDGKPDAIVPNDIGNTISVLLNTTVPGSSTPSLAAAQSFPVGDNPEAATPADVNGDGRPDLVVTNAGDDDFSVLLNTTPPGASTLSFAPEQVFEAGRGPRLPVLEDINGDGRPDLVLANNQFDEHAISVFFNTTPSGASTASFQPRQYFEFFAPGFVLPADVNGDGRPDLIASSQAGADEVVVILNTTPPGASNLSLGSEADLPVGELPNEVRAADLNGDGRSDLVVSNNEGNSVSVLLNGTAPGASIPSFAPQRSFAVGKTPRSLRAVDLNGDGRVDLVVGNEGNHSLTALLNTTAPGTSAPSFSAQTLEAEPGPMGLTTADFNGDGRQDLLYTRLSGKVLISLNTTAAPTAASPSLAAKHESAVGERPSSVVATDLNGDGKPDVVAANRDEDDVSVRLDTTPPGAATPSFSAQQTFAAGNAPTSVASADLNHDGRPDLAISDEFEENVSVLLGTTVPGAGTPSFAARQTFAVGESPSAVASADLNGDGKPDLVLANRDENTASVLFNTTAPGAATPSFSAQQSFATGEQPSSVKASDLNGDGRPDLVVTNQGDDTASVLFNTTAPGASTPSFAAQEAFATGDAPSAVAITDLNGDGVQDLVVANEEADTASVLLNTTAPGAATPSFAAQQPFVVGERPSSVTTADLSGDGVPDPILANRDDTASILLNTTAPGASTPSFAAQGAFAAGEEPSAIVTADLNGDGGPDVVTANGGGDDVSALLDTQYATSFTPTSVTGAIHYAIPRASLSLTPLAFGDQPVGSSTVKTEVLANTGGEELTIGGIAIGGATTEFSEANDCPPTLPVGSSCTIGVTYRPIAATASNASLIVTSDDPSSPETVTLSGTGTSNAPPPSHIPSPEPPGGGKASPSRANLRIGYARSVALRSECAANLAFAAKLRDPRCGELKVVVGGTIDKRARGTVAIKVGAYRHNQHVTAATRARIDDGHWRARIAFPGVEPDFSSPIYVTARFGGSSGIRSAHTKRRFSFK